VEKQSKIPQSMLRTEIAKENGEFGEKIFNLLNEVYPEKELFSIHLAKINDIDELITLLQKTSKNDKPLEEAKIKVVLDKVLPTIYDRSNLIMMLLQVPEEFKHLVESRIIDCCNQKTIRFSNKDALTSIVENFVSYINKGEVYISTKVDGALYDYFVDLTRVERISNLWKIEEKDEVIEEVLKNALSEIDDENILYIILQKIPKKFKPLVMSQLVKIFGLKEEIKKKIKAKRENG
jgi:hypothetical protein